MTPPSESRDNEPFMAIVEFEARKDAERKQARAQQSAYDENAAKSARAFLDKAAATIHALEERKLDRIAAEKERVARYLEKTTRRASATRSEILGAMQMAKQAEMEEQQAKIERMRAEAEQV